LSLPKIISTLQAINCNTNLRVLCLSSLAA